MIALDLETALIERPVAAPKPVCMSWADRSESGVDTFCEHAEARAFSLLSSSEHLVGHNVAFDCAVLQHWYPDLAQLIFDAYEQGRIHDTMLRQKLIDVSTGSLTWHKSNGGYGLARVAERHGLQVDKSDPWRLRYKELDGLPLERWPQQAIDYSRKDAEVTLAVALVQEAKGGLERSGVEAYAAYAFHLSSAWGFRTSPERVKALRLKTEALLVELRAWLTMAGLVRPNGKRNLKAAKSRMVAAWNARGRACPMTEKGEVSLDRDTCILSADPVLLKYADYVRTGTLLARIDDLTEGFTLPLQPRYDSLLESGRASASKGKGPLKGIQIHNFPRVAGPRETVEPRPGTVLVQADYSKCELHTGAQTWKHMFGFSELGQQLLSGVDVYQWFGDQAFPGRGKSARQPSKPIVLGTPGGMGAEKLVLTARKAYQVDLTLEEAKRLRSLLLCMAPEIQEMFNWVKRALGRRETVDLVHPLTGFARAGMRFSAACNFLALQHLAAVLFKDAYCRVTRECYLLGSALYGSRVIAPVHDELVLETPEALAHDAALRLVELMESSAARWCPDYPVKAEPLVTRIWSKAAKPVRDSSGRLIPWAA